ncbi:excisionase [Erwinia amylovora]
MLQILTLEEWAQSKYRSNPPARKEGRFWRVCEDAELVGDLTRPAIKTSDNPLLKRILSDGCTAP